MYLLRLAFRPWRLAPWSQIVSALAVGVLLMITGFIFWIHKGMGPVIARLQSEQIVTAYLAPSVVKAEEGHVVDSIRTTIGSKAVQEVTYVDADQFLKGLKEGYPELGNEVESLGAEEADAIVPRYVSISGVLSEDTVQSLRALSGVERVESSKDRYQQVIVAFRALTWVARLFMAGLCLALLTGLIHLSRVNSFFYRDVLGFLRLWGANRMAILMPGALSGLGVGLLGGAVAFGGWASGSSWLAARLRDLSPALRALPVVTPQMGLLLLLTGALLGMLAGGLAGWLASPARNRSRTEGISGAGGSAWL